MTTRIVLGLVVVGSLLLVRLAPACELVDMAMAAEVLGSEVVDTTVDPETFCMFVSTTTSASFSVQTAEADMYDQVTIPKPHEYADIGDAARYHEFETGGAAVQFLKGSVSVTLGVRTPGGDDGRDYVALLLDVAEKFAAGLE